ncbi:MAG TPA: hypothetical protein VJ987_06680 [Anaerolineales bacterium]|nr:hypothetical protein [Anaerolineales bacterium]
MPQYNNTDGWNNIKIRITPKPLWRKWFWWFPFFVGQKVHFTLVIENMDNYKRKSAYIYETFREQRTVLRPIKFDYETEIEGNIIDREGDVIYGVSPINFSQAEVFPVFTTTVINRDRWALGCAGLVIGAVITVATGIILGLIEVRKFWEIWIP